ncbi:MAG: lipocalin family protein [Pseudomonadota bacterium]
MHRSAPSAPQNRRAFARLAALISAAAASLWLTGCALPPVNRDGDVALTTAKSVDLDRYLGRWYEIARFPNWFEEGCVDVTATYSLKENGDIKVENACVKPSGPDVAVGRAKIVDPETNAKLRVAFFGPFFAPYWILDVAPDYSLALVGEPRGRFLWILAREPALTEAQKDDALAKLDALGYRTDELYWTPQSAANSAAASEEKN